MEFFTPLSQIHNSSSLPPTNVRMAVKDSKKWQEAVMDAFERIGSDQLYENLKFLDYYRMVDGDMSYQEIKDVVPYMNQISDLLSDDLPIPSFLKHYDLLGMITKELVGRYIEFQDKYHITDTGEIANNEFLRFKDKQIQDSLNEQINREVEISLAQMGIKTDGQKFESQEQQQQFLAQIEQKKAELTPKDTKEAAKNSFKTTGVLWGEATLDHDKERYHLLDKEQEAFRDYFLTGRWFRHYKIGYDSYDLINWSPLNTFFSKEISSKYAQDCEYAGRQYYATPSEIIKSHSHVISTDKQKELFGGNEDWKNFVGVGGLESTSIENAVQHNFNKPTWVPHEGYVSYNEYLSLQDYLGTPLGRMTSFQDGKETVTPRFLPKYHDQQNIIANPSLARLYRSDFSMRDDLAVVTEVFFKAQELYGFYTYEDEETGRLVTEEVTEEILPSLIKEKGIKQSYKETIVESLSEDKLEANTLFWFYRPVCFEGLKIQSPNLKEPLYAYCKKSEHQIKGDNVFDIKLPIAGYIGKSSAKKVMPYQIGFNLAMNQAMNLSEKEIGIFLLFDVAAIPSDIPGYGDAKEAFLNMRDMAKDIGIMPAKPTQNGTNIFSVQDLTFTQQVMNKFTIADVYKRGAFETIGSNPGAAMQPSTYETAEGVRVTNEARFTQVSELYETFGVSNKKALELHLSVAQYCQSNKKDITVSYTKSDSSIAYLKIADPNFPLRNLGLVPTRDPKKRKEFELYKQYLISTNTIQSDPVEIAKLFYSDTMQEAIAIATRERDKRSQHEELAHKRQQELIGQQAEQAEAKAQKDFERENILLDKKIEGSIYEANIAATGRASDKKSDEGGFKEIKQNTDAALKGLALDNQHTIANRQEDRLTTEGENKQVAEMEKLRLKTEELRTKLEMKKIDQNIAYANKN